jgi:hypothetical protein
VTFAIDEEGGVEEVELILDELDEMTKLDEETELGLEEAGEPEDELELGCKNVMSKPLRIKRSKSIAPGNLYLFMKLFLFCLII